MSLQNRAFCFNIVRLELITDRAPIIFFGHPKLQKGCTLGVRTGTQLKILGTPLIYENRVRQTDFKN